MPTKLIKILPQNYFEQKYFSNTNVAFQISKVLIQLHVALNQIPVHNQTFIADVTIFPVSETRFDIQNLHFLMNAHLLLKLSRNLVFERAS